MDFSGNNERSPPHQIVSANKRKRKTTSSAATRRAEAMRNNVGSRPDCLLPPAPSVGPNEMLVASNPFDDHLGSQVRGPPPSYPLDVQSSSMDFAMSQPMNFSTTSNANQTIPNTPQMVRPRGIFGHAVGPQYDQPMSTRPQIRLAMKNPPPYPYPSINTMSRMHMSMGNVNVTSNDCQHQSTSDPNDNSELMPSFPPALVAAHQANNNRKAPPLYIAQGPVQPYQPIQFSVGGQIRHRPPMSQLPPSLLGKLPFLQAYSANGGSSILQSQLTRARGPEGNPKLFPTNLPMIFDELNPNAPPIALCGACHTEVFPGQEAIFCGSGCDFWFHRMCTGLTEVAHQMLVMNPYAEWACDNCYDNNNIPLIKFK